MNISVITVGKPPEPALLSLIEPYKKRLRGFGYTVELVCIAGSTLPLDKKLTAEAQAITKHLPAHAHIVLLDERGDTLSSIKLAKNLEQWQLRAKPVAIIIGGAHGVADAIRQQAHQIITLSALTLPHQLVRLLIFEQLYRAADIQAGGSYHHE